MEKGHGKVQARQKRWNFGYEGAQLVAITCQVTFICHTKFRGRVYAGTEGKGKNVKTMSDSDTRTYKTEREKILRSVKIEMNIKENASISNEKQR